MIKNFSIVYDKNMKQYAKELERFVSCIDDVKCMTFQDGNVPENVDNIDKSYVIYIGTKCSENLQFENKFEKYGIQMGWYGTKSWIRLIKSGDGSFAGWLNEGKLSLIADNEREVATNALRYNEFGSQYYRLYKEYRYRKDEAIDKTNSESEALAIISKDFQFLRSKWIDFVAAPWALTKGLIGDSKAYMRVNTFAIMFFCKNYLKLFLNENKTDSLANE